MHKLKKNIRHMIPENWYGGSCSRLHRMRCRVFRKLTWTITFRLCIRCSNIRTDCSINQSRKSRAGNPLLLHKTPHTIIHGLITYSAQNRDSEPVQCPKNATYALYVHCDGNYLLWNTAFLFRTAVQSPFHIHRTWRVFHYYKASRSQ
jgi:hypothetical protein